MDLTRFAQATFTLSATLGLVGYLTLRRKLRVREVTRPNLGVLERWYAASPKRRRVIAAIQGWSHSPEETRSKLESLVRSHVLLRSVTDGKEWIVSEDANVNVEISNEHWTLVGERLISENPTSRDRLWRVCLIESDRVLVIMVDHVLTDGRGLAGLVEALCSGKTMDQEVSFPIPIEAKVGITAGLADLAKELFGKENSQSIFTGPLDKGVDNSTIDQTIIAAQSVSGDSMKRLVNLAKMNHTSVHGVLCAAASLALRDLTDNGDKIFNIATPVSLREKADFGKVLGNYVAGTAGNFPVTRVTSMWELARMVKNQIRKDLVGAERTLGLINLIDDMAGFLQRKEDKYHMGRSGTIEVSNLGLTFSGDVRWYFSQGNHYVGPLVVVNAVTNAKSSEMFLTASARSLCCNRAALSKFLQTMANYLESAS